MRIQWDHWYENYCTSARCVLLPLLCNNSLAWRVRKTSHQGDTIWTRTLVPGSLPQWSFHSNWVLSCYVSLVFSVYDLSLNHLLVTVYVLSPAGLTGPSWTMGIQWCMDWKPAPAPGSGNMPSGEGTLFLLSQGAGLGYRRRKRGWQGCLLPCKGGSYSTECRTFHMEGVHSWSSPFLVYLQWQGAHSFAMQL